MTLSGKNIVITSNEPWGDIWYSKQNYAYELSKNNQVYFINPPRRWSIKNLFYSYLRKKKYSDTLTIVDYENPLPVRSKWLNLLNNRCVTFRIRRYLQKEGFQNFIFWSFDPIRLYNPRALGAVFSIFHCVDFFYFKYLGERLLLKRSDVIFATSQLFLDNYRAFKKPKFIVPHGISSEEFVIDSESAQSFQVKHKDFGLYTGVIDHRLDYDLLERVLVKFQKVDFLFIGPLNVPNVPAAQRIFAQKKYANVYCLGPKHYKTLKYYINQAAFCISFMDMNFHMNIVHHHKTLGYLAQGKPVFSFRYHEYQSLDEIMYMGQGPDQIVEKMERFLYKGEELGLKEKRIAYAHKFIFQKILTRTSNALQQYLNERAT